jgi:hypothetical protein
MTEKEARVKGYKLKVAAVQEHLSSGLAPLAIAAVSVDEINLAMYDVLLHQAGLAG